MQYPQSSIEERRPAAYSNLVPIALEEAPLVVVVDDDPSVLRSLQSLLLSRGLRVQAFSSGAELLAWSELGEASCLILDLAMPETSGWDVVSQLRATRRLVPFVVLSALAEHGDVRAQMLANGADACLRKPASGSELLEAVETALRRRA